VADVLGVAKIPIRLTMDKLDGDLEAARQKIEGSLDKVAKKMGNVGKTLTTHLTLPLVALGVAAAKVGSDFESELEVMAVAARSSGTAIEELSAAALRMGSDTTLVGLSASEAAAAMTSFYKAGLSTTDMFGDLNGYMAGNVGLSGALRSAVDLAAASELDLGQASDVVTVAMATFGLEADETTRITNSFVQAADASVADVGQLAEALKTIGPVANAFGWSLEETNTALALLSERGIVGAEAGTALKSMMTNLSRQTDDVTGTLEMLNVELYNTDGTMRPLPEILAAFETGLAGATEEQRNLAVQTVAGTYGMVAMNTLLAEGAAGWQSMEEGIRNAATAQEVSAARTQTFSGAMESLEGVIETLLITVGVPLIEDFLTPAAKWLAEVAAKIQSSLSPEMTRLIIVLGGVAAAIGPLLIMTAKVISAISGIKTAMAALGVTVNLSLGPLLLVAAALAAVAVAGYKLYEMNKKVEKGTQEVSDAWGQFFQGWQEQGGSAIQIAEDYAATQAKVRDELDKGGIAADLFIRNQDELIASTDKLNMALLRSSGSQEEYVAAARAAGLVTEEEKAALQEAAVTYDVFGNKIQQAVEAETMLSDAMINSHFAVVEQNAALAAGTETLASLNPELEKSRAYTAARAIEEQRLADAVASSAAQQIAAVGSVAAAEEMFAEKFAEIQLERITAATESAAEEARIAEEAAVVYNDLAADIAATLGQMEQELESHQADTEALEADHAARMLALQAAGDADGAALEMQRYADEKARLEGSHAEQIAAMQQQMVERLNIRTQELLLTGQISEQQANDMTAALAKQFGISINETDLAVNHILGQYADWAAGGETTATDIADSIGSIDTKMIELEASETARVQALIDDADRRAQVYSGEATDFEAMVAAIEGSAGRMSDVRAQFDEVKAAIDNLPSEKTVTVRARYEGDPALTPESPILAIQHMLERATAFAKAHPIMVSGEMASPFSASMRGAAGVEALARPRETLASPTQNGQQIIIYGLTLQGVQDRRSLLAELQEV
jgi:TP901 family phage tail tape measure protein